MQSSRARHILRALVPKLHQVQSAQQVFAAAENDWCNGEMQLVNQAGLQILPDCGRAATQPDIQSIRGFLGTLQGRVDTVRNEMKGGASLHVDWRALVMREHKNLRVGRRILTPPAFPLIIRPWTANRSEHVASENPCADSVKAPFRKIVIDTCCTLSVAMNFLKRARGKDPLMKVYAAHAERIVNILVRARPKAVN